MNKNKKKTGTKSGKRTDYLSWDETFMLMTKLIANRSKDPSTQVGACIVNERNVVVGLGYNGFPCGCSDDCLPWEREGDYIKTKYPYVVHAEANAITNANAFVRDCRIYVSLFPCNECAKLIIQNGIKEVIYESNKYKELDSFKAAPRMFHLAGVKSRKFIPKKGLVIKNKKCKK